MPSVELVHGGRTRGGAEALVAERARLVRLCARLTGDPDAAEDLAQEALYQAWRDAHRLRDPDRRPQWLAAIARHLCADWRRRRGRELAHLAPPRAPGGPDGDSSAAAPPGPGAAEETPDDFDLQVELERRELTDLLDRAMALLPPPTRAVLVQRYLEDVPQAHVALRLGLSEGAVEARLQRGKLMLRRVLLTTMLDAALAYGLVRPEDGGWQPTRIWCPSCGERTLVGRFTEEGRLALHCIGCRAVARYGRDRNRWTESGWPALFRGVRGFKPVLNRLLDNVNAGFGSGIVGGTSRCFRCGTTPPLRAIWESVTQRWVAGAHCPRCGQCLGYCSTHFVLLARPEGRAFWREHPRIRPLPIQVVETAGRPAIVTRFQSLTENAELAAVFDRDTFRVLLVDGAPTS